MKTIFFARHAKASQEFATYGDFKRPLIPEGLKRTQKVVKFLKEKGVGFDYILSSPATRAWETAQLLAKGLNYPTDEIKSAKCIYDGDFDAVFTEIFTVPNDRHHLLLVGHNPDITELVNLFAHPVVETLPTSGIVAVTFDTDRWELIHHASKTVEFYVYPKML